MDTEEIKEVEKEPVEVAAPVETPVETDAQPVETLPA